MLWNLPTMIQHWRKFLFRPWCLRASEPLNVDASELANDGILLLGRSLMLIPQSFRAPER